MKHSSKRVLSLLAAAALTCGGLPQNAPFSLSKPALTASADGTYDDLTYKVSDDGNSVTITGYTGSAASLVIPEKIDNKPVTAIDDWVFFNKTTLLNIDLPDSITKIGSSAFNGCENLAEIDLPDSLKTIGDNAFIRCSSLTEVTIPDKVESIETGAFSSCSKLKTVVIPEGVENIGESAFRDTPWLQAMQAENPLVIVNNILIDGTTASGVVAVPDGVKEICGLAFNQCQTLTKIKIPASVKSIGNNAFYYCKGLTSIEMSDGLTSIGDRAFYECSGLTEIDIPDTVKEIGAVAFYNCTTLAKVCLPASLTEIKGTYQQGTFQSCTSLKEIEIPEGVTKIGRLSFALCSNLEKIKIPRSATEIDASAFIGRSNGLKIDGYSGSAAETFATSNDIAFNALTDIYSGVSVTLKEDVGLNFIAAEAKDDNYNRYQVKLEGKCVENGKSLGLVCRKINGKVVYCASASVAPHNMREKITAKLYKDGKLIDTYTYSVYDYLMECQIAIK